MNTHGLPCLGGRGLIGQVAFPVAAVDGLDDGFWPLRDLANLDLPFLIEDKHLCQFGTHVVIEYMFYIIMGYAEVVKQLISGREWSRAVPFGHVVEGIMWGGWVDVSKFLPKTIGL